MQAIFDKNKCSKTAALRSRRSSEFIRLLNKHTVNHIMVVHTGNTAERFNRALKENIHEILNAMG